jgi:hypothetical protein
VDTGRPKSRKGRGKTWAGTLLIVLGVLFSLGFFFVPPQDLIPALLSAPGVLPMPEVLLGYWAVLVGVGLLVADAVARARKRDR